MHTHCANPVPKPYVREAFRKSLECGIFASCFAGVSLLNQIKNDEIHMVGPLAVYQRYARASG